VYLSLQNSPNTGSIPHLPDICSYIITEQNVNSTQCQSTTYSVK